MGGRKSGREYVFEFNVISYYYIICLFFFRFILKKKKKLPSLFVLIRLAQALTIHYTARAVPDAAYGLVHIGGTDEFPFHDSWTTVGFRFIGGRNCAGKAAGMYLNQRIEIPLSFFF